jgi:hypothetical protein
MRGEDLGIGAARTVDLGVHLAKIEQPPAQSAGGLWPRTSHLMTRFDCERLSKLDRPFDYAMMIVNFCGFSLRDAPGVMRFHCVRDRQPATQRGAESLKIAKSRQEGFHKADMRLAGRMPKRDGLIGHMSKRSRVSQIRAAVQHPHSPEDEP